ncbi:ABC transporter permease [Kineosporia succinea]|uniref:ABC-type nitrate/sulfonate/bicarbonate transport system permease component n=1 Tax=Kineosporia succinea TaxID=84632 RepID=A0ABT9NV16_9ACTN|nr:ABC transporter permease subunit [Kineosporia succinea]MDP9824275.1 ABC-type nitrate/sulfonate/bicarbonate transport system permease component [Kineosporia succinea]
MNSPSRPGRLGGAVGTGLLLVLWSVLALTVVPESVPTPWAVLAQMADDGWDLYATNAGITLRGAALGFVWGNGAALAVATLALLLPPLETVATQLAVISYCVPLTAIGPIVLVIFGGRAPTVFLAALSVFFTTLVGSLLGLKAADRASLDLVSAYGGGRFAQLRKVRLVAAAPHVLNALKIAAPAAMLGAILGEYLGGIDNGLGVALTVAQQQYVVPRTWALALVTGLLAGLGYAFFALLARFTTPWATS